MSIINRYILTQIARPFLATLGIALLVMLIERMLRILDLVVGWRGGLSVVAQLMFFLVPHYLSLALPVALFLAIYLAIARLSRDSELDALLGAGFGLHQLVRPIFLGALALTFVIGLVVSVVQPYARYAYRSGVHALTNTSLYALLAEDTFATVDSTTFLVDKIRGEGEFEGVFIYEGEGGGASSVTTARRGKVGRGAERGGVEFRLERGLRHTTPDPLLRSQSGDPSAITLRFGEFTTTAQVGDGGAFRERGGHERELTLVELWRLTERDLPPEVKPSEVRAELHGRLTMIATMLVLPFFAAPLGVQRRRAVRFSGLIIGLTVLIVYNQLMQFGEASVEDELVAPWLGLWVPFGVFMIGSLLLFRQTAFRPAGGRMFDRIKMRLGAAILRMPSLYLRRAKQA